MAAASSQEELVERLVAQESVTSPSAVHALRAVDRACFVGSSPYEDSPKPLGSGHNVSAPHMHAMCLDSLSPFLRDGAVALDVGSGSGYLTACMAKMCGPSGLVVGLDNVEDFVEVAEKNIRKAAPDLLEEGRVILATGNALQPLPDNFGPFDCIHVGATCEVPPEGLISKLKKPGRMVVPVGNSSSQKLLEFSVDETGEMTEKPICNVRFGPMVDNEVPFFIRIRPRVSPRTPPALKMFLGSSWRSSGSSQNDELVTLALRRLHLQNLRVCDAMKRVDRGFFCETTPYEDSPQQIYPEINISAPHMHAQCLISLEPFLKEGSIVLDIGCGSGYLTACMAIMCGVTGKVFGVDNVPELVRMSARNIQQSNPALLADGNITLTCANGMRGLPARGPFDAIHVGAACPTLPDELIQQLKSPGRLVIPVGTVEQQLLEITKDEHGKVSQQSLGSVLFGPLINKGAFPGHHPLLEGILQFLQDFAPRMQVPAIKSR